MCFPSLGTQAPLLGVGGFVNVPLHSVYLRSGIVTGQVSIEVKSTLPVAGGDFILGNDVAGGKVAPNPIVVDVPL